MSSDLQFYFPIGSGYLCTMSVSTKR